MQLFDFYKYKYQLNFDGTVSPYRTAAMMAGNSLVCAHCCIHLLCLPPSASMGHFSVMAGTSLVSAVRESL